MRSSSAGLAVLTASALATARRSPPSATPQGPDSDKCDGCYNGKRGGHALTIEPGYCGCLRVAPQTSSRLGRHRPGRRQDSELHRQRPRQRPCVPDRPAPAPRPSTPRRRGVQDPASRSRRAPSPRRRGRAPTRAESPEVEAPKDEHTPQGTAEPPRPARRRPRRRPGPGRRGVARAGLPPADAKVPPEFFRVDRVTDPVLALLVDAPPAGRGGTRRPPPGAGRSQSPRAVAQR